MLVDLSHRNTEPELMDNPMIDSDTLKEVLIDLNRVNKMLNGKKITVNAVAQLIKEHPKEVYTIVDMGCGDGWMLRELALFCKKKNIKANFIGVDFSERAIQLAKLASVSYPEIQFLQQDILSLKASDLGCDILMCTLTMHHFNDEQISIFLKKFTNLARFGIVVNDLQRSRLAYYLFTVFGSIFIKTSIAKHDGLISIKSGFTKADLLNLAKGLPHIKHRIQSKWAFRYIWLMRTHGLSQCNE